MACINSDNFSANDLNLFIESIELISRMEQKKKERLLQHRAQYLADTLRYLDQQYPASSSSTLSSTDDPEDESVMENIEEKQIASVHYAVKDLLYDSSSEEKVNEEECTAVLQNVYQEIGAAGHADDNDCGVNSFTSGIYSMPVDCLESTKLSKASSAHNVYEQISPVSSKSHERSHKSEAFYSEPLEAESTLAMDAYIQPVPNERKKSFKKTLLGLVCKKYRQRCNSKSSNIWCKSESWMKLTVM